jgi:predicted nucleic acid-binding protein
MLKRKRVSIEQAFSVLAAYKQIPLQFSEVDLVTALELSSKFKIYAYDAYVISCALKHKSPLVTLDEKLRDIAQSAGAVIREVRP